MATAAELALASMDTGFDPNRQNQDFIDPNWPGLVSGSGTFNPGAVDPLIAQLGFMGMPGWGALSRFNPTNLVSNLVNRYYNPSRIAKMVPGKQPWQTYAPDPKVKVGAGEIAERSLATAVAKSATTADKASDIMLQQIKRDPLPGGQFFNTWWDDAAERVFNPGFLSRLGGKLSPTRGLPAQLAVKAAPVTSAINPVTATAAALALTRDAEKEEDLIDWEKVEEDARAGEFSADKDYIPAQTKSGIGTDLEERIGYNEADTLRQHSEIVRDSRSSPLQRSQSAQTLIESVANRPYIAPFISGGEEVKSSTEKVLDTFLPSAFNIKNIDQVKSEILGNIDFDLDILGMETEITPQTPEQYLQSIEDAGATGEQIVPRRLFTRKPLRYYMPEYLESTGPEPDVAPSIWYTGEIPEEGPGILDRLRQAIIPDVGAATAPVDVSDITRPINPSVSRTVEGLPEELEALVQLIQSDPDVSKKYIGPRDATVTTPLLANLMSATPVETFEDIPIFQPGAETAWTPPAPVVPDITETLADFSDIQSAQEKAAQKAQDKIDRGLKHAANVRRKDEKKARLAEARDKKAEAKKIAAQAAEEKQRRANEVKFANMLKQANETHRAYLSRKREEEARRKRLGYGVGAMYT